MRQTAAEQAGARVLLLEVAGDGGMAAKTVRRVAIEGSAICIRLGVVQASGVRLPDLEQPVGDGIDGELVVAVRLLGLGAIRAVPRLFGLVGLGQQIDLVGGEQIELALDELREAVAAASHHLSSRYRARCAAAAASQDSSLRARSAPTRAAASADSSVSRRSTAPLRASTSPAGATAPAPKRRTGSPRPPTSYVTAGIPAPSTWSNAPDWSSSGRYGKTPTVASANARSSSAPVR